ncbi:metallophosphoesterase family protein [Arthrobacter sp. MDT1-65]
MTESPGARPWAVAGDWHGSYGWARTAVKSAARQGVKTLIHVGDFGLDWPGAMRGRLEQRLNRTLIEHDMEVLVSPGNHDCLTNIDRLDVQDDGLIHWRSNIRILPKGGRTVIDGLRIGGLGGALSVDKKWRTEGKNWWADEEPSREQAEMLIAGGSLDVLVTHDVPLGVSVRSAFNLPADLAEQADRTRTLLREVVDRLAPSHVFAGHWHQRLTQELVHPDGRVTRVDVLNMENSRDGNCILVWPGSTPLGVESLSVRGG